ncbi:acetyltransferase [Bacteroidales bacterium]
MYLYGASGHAKVIIDLLQSQNIEIAGLIDDNPALTELLGYPVLRDTADKNPVIVSIGDNAIRKKLAEKLSDHQFGTAVHSTSVLSPNCKIDKGTVVMQGAIIQSDARVGKHCIVNTGASVDHDCVVEDFVHLSPQSVLCGNVHIGEGSWIGAGSVVIPGVKIGKWCVIAAGSVVTKDIPDYSLAAGNRAKVIKSLK